MFRTLPVRAPEELVEPLSKYPDDPRMNGFSWEFYEHVRDHNHVFADVIGMAPARFEVTRDGAEAETVDGEYAVGTLFPVARPAAGDRPADWSAGRRGRRRAGGGRELVLLEEPVQSRSGDPRRAIR